MEDSGEFDLEPDVTYLVGKNESGRTADLQALYRFNPTEESAVFNEVIDFPCRLTKQRKQAPTRGQVPVVTATFRLTEDEIAAIEADLGTGALTRYEFTVTMGYRYTARTNGLNADEAVAPRTGCAQLIVS